MTEAHPLRCETCDNKGFAPDYVTQLNGSEFQCYGGKVVRDLTKERLTLISIVGCASHSSAKSDAVLVFEYSVPLPSKTFPSITRRKLALNDIGESEDGFTRIDFELKNGDTIQVLRQQQKER